MCLRKMVITVLVAYLITLILIRVQLHGKLVVGLLDVGLEPARTVEQAGFGLNFSKFEDVCVT